MKIKNRKNKLLLMLLLLFVIGLGIGYAVLTQQLTINNTINYGSMKWDVGFTEVVDLSDVDVSGSAVDFISGSATISSDKKSLSITCDLGVRVSEVTCSTAVVVSNNSSFDVVLDGINSGGSAGNLSRLNVYLKDQYVVVCETNNDCEELVAGYILKAGESKTVAVHLSFKELTEDILPESDLSINYSILLDWVEAPKVEIINFSVDGTAYTAEKGMTWEEFVASEYNSNEYFAIYDENYVYFNYDSMWILYGNGEKSGDIVKPADQILDGHTYSWDECCFDPGSQVLMADGTTKNIEDVQVGDIVMSLNEDTGEYIAQRVTATIIKENSTDLVYVNLSNGTKIGMRAYHPLLTTEGWKSLRPKLIDTIKEVGNVDLLEVGDTLVGYGGNVTVVSIEQRPEVENYNTYNLSVEGYHNYIVEGVVVHNAWCSQ